MKRLKTRLFTVGIVAREDRVLVLKRKKDDDTYPGLWDCVGGHFEKGETAEECMLREAEEEAGLEMEIVRPGSLIEYRDQYGRSVAVPFLLRSPSEEVSLSEHTAYEWLTPEEARKLQAVPSLKLGLAGFGL